MAVASGLDFATLDALLDQALDCDDAGRKTLLESLPDAQASALAELLDASGSDVLAKLGAAVRSTVDDKSATPKPRDSTRRAGSWRLRGEIGHGGTGQVFLADRSSEDPGENTDFSQRAAVKVLWSHRVGSQFSERFFRERRILASIEHPGIARFLDGGLLGDNRPWFAMEYIEGKDIVTACRDRSIEDRLRLLLEVCQTIAYAHRRLIVHRDIKPGNVLVDSSDHARVLDFGIARILGDAEEPALTRAGGVPLTLRYASPEQVSDGPLDIASDVYQLGVLAYEMLTDNRPYEVSENSLHESVRTIMEQIPPLASTHNARIKPDVDAIVAKALAKDPGHRYAQATDFAEDIRRHLKGLPVTARDQTSLYLTGRFLRRHGLLASIVAASVIALTAATVYSLGLAREAREAAERSRATLEILTEVFAQSDPFGEGGADITLAEALIQARPTINSKIESNPRLSLEVNEALASIFLNLDMLEYEVAAHEAAWAAAETLGAGFERQRIVSVAGIGNAKTRIDPADAAEFLRTNLPDQPPTSETAVAWLAAKYAEANAWLRLRDLQRVDAIAVSMSDVSNAHDVDDPRTLGRINQLLAGSARRAGDIPAADQYWQRAVDFMSEAGQPAGHAVFLSNQALHFGKTGRYDESERVFLEAISLFRQHDPKNTSLANILRSYAGLQFRIGSPQAALDSLAEALTILNRDRDHYAYFGAQNSAASYAFANSDFDASIEAIEDGLDLALEMFGPYDAVTARMLPNLARVLAFAGDEQATAHVLGLHEIACAPSDVRRAAIETALTQQSPSNEGREQLQSALAIIETGSALDLKAFNTLVQHYYEADDVFIDPLDRLSYLEALEPIAISNGYPLPEDINSSLQVLRAPRTEVAAMIAGAWSARISGLLTAIAPERARVVCRNL
ncbi:MAG: serine/threonine-protein kinase [Pseudomonadota bacterium]